MMPNDFGHAFALIARTTSDIQNALTTGQIELPNCLQSLRHHIPCEIGFFESFGGFLGEFKPVHLRLPPSRCIEKLNSKARINQWSAGHPPCEPGRKHQCRCCVIRVDIAMSALSSA